MRQRDGFARFEHGKFESLEPRTLLAGHGSICLAPGIHQSSGGEIFYIDADSSEYVEPAKAVIVARDAAARVDVERLPQLHSHASASQRIYLDFNGHTVGGTDWNELHYGQTIHAPAFDLDGDATTFDATELALIENVWARVAEDFAPFEIDVTTEAPSVRSLRAGSEAIRVLISSNVDAATGRTWMHTGNGVAFLHSWRSASDTPVWVFANRLGASDKRIAESVSHELGHAFGLHHDGVTDGSSELDEYFAGHGDSVTGWAPIMGLGYHRPVTQWNQGEYEHSNNLQRDIDVIASEQNGIRLRTDDHADNFVFATFVAPEPAGTVAEHGLISTRSDRDAFRMELASGVMDLVVSPSAFGANLDVEVALHDGNGRLIDTFRSDSNLSARIRTNVAAGTYFISVDGVGRGDPADEGYSDYGSLGRYSITGTVPNSSVIVPDGNASPSDEATAEMPALSKIRSAAVELRSTQTSDRVTLADWLALQTQRVAAFDRIRAAARRLM